MGHVAAMPVFVAVVDGHGLSADASGRQCRCAEIAAYSGKERIFRRPRFSSPNSQEQPIGPWSCMFSASIELCGVKVRPYYRHAW